MVEEDLFLYYFLNLHLQDQCFIDPKRFVLADKDYKSVEEMVNGMKFVKAGPRKQIYFDPDEVCAAIVTCGGLCPGNEDFAKK